MTNNFPFFSGPEHQPFEMGDGSAGGALLIHGFPGTPAEMRPLGEWLAERGWHAHGILLPGFGAQFAHLADRKSRDWVTAARAAWRKLRADFGGPALAVGYSMGASVALHLELGPADRLVLAAPLWSFPGVLPKIFPLAHLLLPDLHPVSDDDFSQPQVRRQFERLLPGVDLDDPRVQAEIEAHFVIPASALQEVLKLGRSAYRRAASIDANALVIQGRNDRLAERELTLKLTRRLTKGRSVYLETDGGHDLLIEDTPGRAEMFAGLGRFLDTGEV